MKKIAISTNILEMIQGTTIVGALVVTLWTCYGALYAVVLLLLLLL